ncbi:hypothetical protein EB796_009787 [Bugula neritina]|uniref:Uncharacterized protein n=1 Tax=Bugula neritina TaxID=10212 RepID=A0A7J7K139_BUGNE|nr:hypothetical protein EB796_009787 [Bugula neritina]
MDEVEIQDKEMDVLDTDEDATKETESKRKASCNGDLEKKILINLDVDEKNPSATLDSESVAKSPTTSLSFVDDIMGALSDRGIKVNSRDSTASTPSQEVPDSGTGSEGQATSPGVCKPLYSRSISDCEAKEPTQGKPALASPPPLSSRLKPRLASPPPLSTKPKPLDKTRSARSSVTSTDAADGKTDDGKDEKPAEAVTTSLASQVKPTSSLVHLAKDRPKRVKKQAARRPVPKAALTSDEADESAVDDFFKPAAVSQTPVLVSAPPPTAKPRTGSLDKSEGAAKAEKPDGSPKLKAKLRSPFGGSHKDKQDSEKKKG